MNRMNKYIEQLESRVEELEAALEANQRKFSPLLPDAMFIVVKPFKMVDRFICSFNRVLNKIIHNKGLHLNLYKQTDDMYGLPSNLCQFEYINYMIPVGTIFKIQNYEIKRRRRDNYDFVKTTIIEFPGVPEATGQTFRMKSNHFNDIEAVSYNKI